MAKQSKAQSTVREKLQPGKQYSALEAVNLVKKCATAKFDESFDVAVLLGIDARKSEQAVRGATVLPHGTGKTVRVAVFAQDDQAAVAKNAGADIVGFEDLADIVKTGKLEADVVIATPDAMRLVGQLGQILGPKGLMPNPKVGTVTKDIAAAVKNAKSGQVRYRIDKNGIIHCAIGKVSFSSEALVQHIESLMTDLKKMKPASAKGAYFKKLVVSSTMGPGFIVDLSSLSV